MPPSHLPASARHSVFAPLDNGDRVRAVEERLAKAIQLGLIADGEQLPSESELAAQLGVAATTLREALGGLRREGLIYTRRGRGGGSFARAPRERAAARLRAKLVELSVDDLRDIGDRRVAIAAAAAELAASRAADEDRRRLHQHVEALAEAANPPEAQRADAHFHIELAATARSSWLTGNEHALQAELGSLISLTWEQGRSSALQEHGAILDAVDAGDAEAARRRTEAHIARETRDLVQLHLQLTAADDGRRRRATAHALRAGSRAALEAAHAALERVFTSVEETRDVLAALFTAAEARGTGLRRADLESLRSRLHAQLAEHRALIAGTGVVFAQSTLTDAPRWLEWWRAAPNGHPTFLTVSLNPEDADYYDFEGTDWFSTPRRTGKRNVTGPYVDYSGTDEHILTLTTAIQADGRFLGVAGADVRVGQIEPLIGASLRSIGVDAVLVEVSGRIIASASPRWLPGLLLDSPDRTWVREHQDNWVTRSDGATLLRDPRTGWAVVTLPAP